jgi:aspartyl-tRNA(Asn)/glutamyl-tRNA(Gln) amidotransferase subunit A
VLTRRELLAGTIALPITGMRQAARKDALTSLTVAQIYEQFARRTLSPVDLVEAYIARIERLNPVLEAYVTVTAPRAREQAKAAMKALVRGAQPGPLHGVPIAHKDLFETAGIRTTAGSRLYADHIPARDAEVVAKLTAAGAVLLGKTNTHELGGGATTINPFFGTTHNPWDVKRIAGGSSGGSGAAVAAQLAAAATGTDTGGSIRIPAALCGCVGYKPSYGRVPTAGILSWSPTFDHAGVLTRTVEDAALTLEVIDVNKVDISEAKRPVRAGEPVSAATLAAMRSSNRFRVGVARSYFFEALDPDVAASVETAIGVFRKLGAEVRDCTLPVDAKTMDRVFNPIIVAEIWQSLGDRWKQQPGAFSKSFAGFFEAPRPSAAELAAAQQARREFESSMTRALEGLDVAIMPTVPTTAPLIDGPIDGFKLLRNTWPFNAAHTPAISVPCGFDRSGLPIGLQLVAKVGDDAALLQAAYGYEQRAGWYTKRPSI